MQHVKFIARNKRKIWNTSAIT